MVKGKNVCVGPKNWWQIMEKSFISVKWVLIIAIIIILVIGLVGTVQLFFPWLGTGFSCIQLQRSHIDEVNTVIEEVLLTGEEQIIRFRVEECTMCIWYNSTDAVNDIHILEVEYEAANESFLTPMKWDGDIDSSDSGRPDCQPGHLVGREGRKVCTVDITVNPRQAQVIC